MKSPGRQRQIGKERASFLGRQDGVPRLGADGKPSEQLYLQASHAGDRENYKETTMLYLGESADNALNEDARSGCQRDPKSSSGRTSGMTGWCARDERAMNIRS